MNQSPVLIIGGSRGIGRRCAELLIESGTDVISVARGSEHAPGVLEHHQLDVLNDEIQLDGHERLGGLIYCPGSIDLKPMRSIKPEQLRDAFELNVVSAMKSIQSALPALKKEQGSGIVMFSTVAVQRGMGFHASVAAAKGAVEGLTRALAAELSPTVRVNCIAPSLTRTELASHLLNTDAKEQSAAERHPLKRVGTVDDVAHMAVHLVGERSSWITGQVIGVDGGLGSI